MGDTLFGGNLQQQWNEIGTSDTFRQWISKNTRGPNQGSAVAEDKVRIEKNTAEFNIVRGLDQKINIRGDEIVRLTRGNHLVDELKRFCGGDVIERDPQNGDR